MTRRDDGFTLLEILIVLAIMGAVLGIAVMHGPLRSEALQTRAAAGALAQTFRAARAQAIERAQTVAVVIDPERHSFAADLGPARMLAPDMKVVLLPGTLHGPGDTGLVRFAPDGSASGGGVVFGSARRRLRVDVEWLTGRVRVADAA
jgi:general secretion pathway protein H